MIINHLWLKIFISNQLHHITVKTKIATWIDNSKYNKSDIRNSDNNNNNNKNNNSDINNSDNNEKKNNTNNNNERNSNNDANSNGKKDVCESQDNDDILNAYYLGNNHDNHREKWEKMGGNGIL